MRVLVSGAGVGGLALAQALRQVGVAVAVFERDPTPDLRGQGYRIHIDAKGDAALEACLPPELFGLYLSTSDVAEPERRMSVFDHRLRELQSHAFPAARYTAVNRLTLRQILLHGLDDTVHFGHTVTAAGQDGDRVWLRFEDGSEATGDVLVGADGVHSVVRPLVAPGAAPAETGTFGIYGRTPLPPEGFPGIPMSGFTAVVGRHGRTLALSTFRPRTPVAAAGAALGVTLDDVEDYAMWCALMPERPEGDAAQLHRLAKRHVRGWHETVRDLVGGAETGATFGVTIRTSNRVPAWPPSRITLLGDAVHTMTPAGGAGANTALHDAAWLAAELSTSDGVVAAIGRYEGEMREYGFAAVEASLKGLR